VVFFFFCTIACYVEWRLFDHAQAAHRQPARSHPPNRSVPQHVLNPGYVRVVLNAQSHREMVIPGETRRLKDRGAILWHMAHFHNFRTRRGKLQIRYSARNPGRVIRTGRFCEQYIEGLRVRKQVRPHLVENGQFHAHPLYTSVLLLPAANA
jgi:hypothetical protein